MHQERRAPDIFSTENLMLKSCFDIIDGDWFNDCFEMTDSQLYLAKESNLDDMRKLLSVISEIEISNSGVRLIKFVNGDITQLTLSEKMNQHKIRELISQKNYFAMVY
jgi:hypothetical protein